jgi:hypothetical protein
MTPGDSNAAVHQDLHPVEPTRPTGQEEKRRQHQISTSVKRTDRQRLRMPWEKFDLLHLLLRFLVRVHHSEECSLASFKATWKDLHFSHIYAVIFLN